MKYCPYCGADLLEDALFCMECGKTIPVSREKAQPEQERKRPQTRSKKQRPRKPAKSDSAQAASAEDPGYDGYYDDIPVADDGAFQEKMDRAQINRIVLVGVGALVIVVLSVVVMKVL